MYACDYLENGVLNVLRGVTFAAPAKVYLALYLNDPGEDGASGTEVSYAGYKRIEIDFSSPAETNGGIGVQNLEDITFPTPVTAAGTITHVGILDSLAGGNMLCRGELVEPLVIGADEPPVFLAGDVLFYLTGNLSRAWKTKVLNILRGQSIQGIAPYFSLWNGSRAAPSSPATTTPAPRSRSAPPRSRPRDRLSPGTPSRPRSTVPLRRGAPGHIRPSTRPPRPASPCISRPLSSRWRSRKDICRRLPRPLSRWGLTDV